MLDPWLFPLTDEHFDSEITCRVLMLANEYFLSNQDVHDRNKKFLSRHAGQINYLCWKKADHLHQCDIPFVVGTSLGAVKNCKQSGEMLDRNIQAVSMFLALGSFTEGEEKLGKHFSEFVLDQAFQP